MEPGNLSLDEYFLRQTQLEKPRVCFLASASGDSDYYIRKFYQSFTKLNCVPSHLGLFDLQTSDLASYVFSHDAIYVGGGNLRSLMGLWREWQLDRIFLQAYEAGILLGGMSAGSLCWFQEGMADSMPGQFASIKCVGLIEGSHCPHYSSDTELREAYKGFIGSDKMSSGFAADDGVALHFIDGKLHRVVSSRPEARAYRVWRDTKTVREDGLEVEVLRAWPE